ncbi:MAG: 2-phosphosulfolactate phosphatase [Candidatus Heimdallarchaeota archaeon]
MKVTLQGNLEGSQYAAKEKAIAVIIDTLRASTTMPTAMSKGITELFVAKEVDDVRLSAKENNTLLMGERGCIMLDGFNFGNSPTELMKQTGFENTKVSFTSSTGSRRTVDAIGSDILIIGSPINAKAVAKLLVELTEEDEKKSVVLIPCFTEGSIIDHELTEDQLGGLVIAMELKNLGVELPADLLEEVLHFEERLSKQTLKELYLETKHGQKLIDLQFEADVEFCSQISKINFVPISRNDIVTLGNGSKVVKFKQV